jgi:hypothetical protein
MMAVFVAECVAYLIELPLIIVTCVLILSVLGEYVSTPTPLKDLINTGESCGLPEVCRPIARFSK